MFASSTPKPPPKPRRLYNNLLEKREDISIHEKLEIIIENQKAFFKFMADVMRGGFVGKHDVNQGLGHVPNMGGESNVPEGRDRASSVSAGRNLRSNVSVGRDGASRVSEERDRASSISVGRDGGSNISVGRDRESSVSEERDWDTSNFVAGKISIVMGGSCSLGEGNRENDIVSQGSGGTQQGSLRDILNVMGRSGQGCTGNIVSRGSRVLGDISNVMEEGYREIGNVSQEQSLREEDKIFMGEL